MLSADGLLLWFCGGVVVDRKILLLLLLTDGYTIVVVSIFHDGCGASRIYRFVDRCTSVNGHLLRRFRRWIATDYKRNNRPTLTLLAHPADEIACPDDFSSVKLIDPDVENPIFI